MSYYKDVFKVVNYPSTNESGFEEELNDLAEKGWTLVATHVATTPVDMRLVAIFSKAVRK